MEKSLLFEDFPPQFEGDDYKDNLFLASVFEDLKKLRRGLLDEVLFNEEEMPPLETVDEVDEVDSSQSAV